MHKVWDAVMIGAGPAGISCAIWLKQMGFNALLVEASDRVGGLSARNPFTDFWTPTVAGRSGIDIAHDMASQLKASDAQVWLNSPVQAINQITSHQSDDKQETLFNVSVLHDGQIQEIVSRTVVIAAGVKARPLNPGQDESWPGVLVGPGEKVMQQNYKGMRVALLGGGDNAFENYEFVKSKGALQAHIYARSVRAQKKFISRVVTADVHVGPYVVEPNSRTVNGHVYDLIMVLYGWEAQASFAASLALKYDAKGFIATEHSTAQTSQPGVYAIGEVAQRMHPCVVTAFADGVVAAKAIEARLTS